MPFPPSGPFYLFAFTPRRLQAAQLLTPSRVCKGAGNHFLNLLRIIVSRSNFGKRFQSKRPIWRSGAASVISDYEAV